jgi:midasin
LEQVASAISADEPVLLVGETGTGKTTLVQEVASILGKKLHVFNMNQNTDSADLLGGFKPVDLKYLLTPIYGRFRELFCRLLNASTSNNQSFLDLLQKCYEQNKINDFIKCLQHGMKSIKSKQTDDPAVIQLEGSIKDL